MPQRHRHRHRRPAHLQPAPPLPSPLADPSRPVPNLLAADRFEYFYRRQGLVRSSGEWRHFISTLHQPLPVSFRVSTAPALAHLARQCLDEGAALLRGTGALPAAAELRWCASWLVDVKAAELKAAARPELRAMHEWLTKFGSLGVLTRQAVESMVPVALLRVEPHHAVLDMCASPGSKTTQAIEALFRYGEAGASERGSGFVVANDASPARCQMLLRRCAALGEMCSQVVVTCHPAQRFPRLAAAPHGEAAEGPAASKKRKGREATKQGRKEAGGGALTAHSEGSFDRIICDVPCSGDGTTRKNPSVWHRWTVEYALSMHPLQLQIALRGVALLKVGGLMAFSTCSLNPCENESVVAELLRRTRGAVELVDASAQLPELARAQGLCHWEVLDDEMCHYESFEAMQASGLPAALKRKFLPSMWPPPAEEAPPLHRCLRLLPHLANMGGFFVALLRKVAPLPGPLPKRTPRGESRTPPPPPPPPPPPRDASCFGEVSAASLGELSAQHALQPAALAAAPLAAELLARGGGGGGVLVRVAPQLRPLCTRAPQPSAAPRLRVIAAGYTVARRSRRGVFQLTHEGAATVAPYARRRRRLEVPVEDGRAFLSAAANTVPLAELSPSLKQAAAALPVGPVLLLFRTPHGSATLPMPGRRLRSSDSLRLLVPFTPGLEFRPKATLHALRFQLGLQDSSHAAEE
ncbi:hypothetical protein AB1Y20_005925 [Prymnesium parvum]|uniref:SAM-dependent MTase RsmB/NOP-type domain-containing protein n=1 Tax=Prymnesium parvum TaxID=97485 RepID=A0AB34J173_PRYPA